MLFLFVRKLNRLLVLPEGWNPCVFFESDLANVSEIQKGAVAKHGPGELKTDWRLLHATNIEVARLSAENELLRSQLRVANRLVDQLTSIDAPTAKLCDENAAWSQGQSIFSPRTARRQSGL